MKCKIKIECRYGINRCFIGDNIYIIYDRTKVNIILKYVGNYYISEMTFSKYRIAGKLVRNNIEHRINKNKFEKLL